MLTLSPREAALCIGTSKGRVYRAIQAGRLRAHRGAFGRYAIEPRELFRAFLPQFQHANWDDASRERPAVPMPQLSAAIANSTPDEARRAIEAALARLR